MKAPGAWTLVIAAVVVVMTCPCLASGQNPRAQAIALAREAAALADQGRLEDALSLFQDAYRLDPAPILLGHMGKVYEQMGELGKARQMYERLIADETNPERRERGRELLADVLARLPGRLIVVPSPSDAAISLEPILTAIAPVTAVQEQPAKAEADVEADVVPESLPVAEPVTEPAIATGVPGEIVSGSLEMRTNPWPWVCIGTGAGALVAGAVMTGLAYADRSKVAGASRDGDVVTGLTMAEAQSRVDRSRRYDATSYAMYGIGGAAIVAGIVLLATDAGKTSTGRESRPALGASPIPGGMVLGSGWRF